MSGQCLDKQANRCTDRQAVRVWVPALCAYVCARCRGIVITEEELAAKVKP